MVTYLLGSNTSMSTVTFQNECNAIKELMALMITTYIFTVKCNVLFSL